MKLFSPIRIGNLTVPNRIVKSAMVEGRAEAGLPTQGYAVQYEQWARGGVGLSVTGMVTVLRGWGLTDAELDFSSDKVVAPFRQVTEAAHRHGGCVAVQLCHAPPQILRRTAQQRGGSVSISAGFNRTNFSFDRALTSAELTEIVGAFGAAARRAREAGADAVQLHAAHGYLLSRSLSPKHNRRDDAWGGDVVRRMALLREVVTAVRREAGPDFPLLIKLNAHDGEPGGLTLGDAVQIAGELERLGVDAIEVSAATGDVGMGFYPNKGGIPVDLGQRFLRREVPALKVLGPALGPILKLAGRAVKFPGEAYFLTEAATIAAAVSIPVIAVGGIRSLRVAERILADTRVAMVAMARPFVRDPWLVQKWRRQALEASTCTSCNRCFVDLGLGSTLRCTAP